jgi:ABC-type transport system involved in cytochrome c biogenesis permease subunit
MSETLLLFLFLGYMALRGAFDDRDKADKVTAILAVVGVVNIPIIHYSVEWWNSLHQGPTITRGAMATEMLLPFLVMVLAFTLTFYWLLLRRLQAYGSTLAMLIVNVWLVRAKHRAALRRAREITAQAEVPRKQPKVHRVQ